MILVDTSVWIEFLKKREPFHSQMKQYLERNEILAIECIFGELLQGAKNKREREIIDAYWRHLPKTDEQGLWIEAGRYSGEAGLPSKGVGLIDAVLLVASRRTGTQLWTLDKKLQEARQEQ